MWDIPRSLRGERSVTGAAMTDEHLVLIVYDICNDKRRTKLHNVLLDYGTPVQYSVFECILDQNQQEKLAIAIQKVIRPRVDQVRTYHLCAICAEKVEVTCGKEVLTEKESSLIV